MCCLLVHVLTGNWVACASATYPERGMAPICRGVRETQRDGVRGASGWRHTFPAACGFARGRHPYTLALAIHYGYI
jgi:hypothetical protein